MAEGKTIIIVLVTLVLGFSGGFFLRPVIAPAKQAVIAAAALPAAPGYSDARGTQYFIANIDEARHVVSGCRDGSVRGGECATAEEAIITVDAQERRKRFLGN
ncbi:hypothetical protein ACPVPU_12355 [Sphingomonas sp. CJ99]